MNGKRKTDVAAFVWPSYTGDEPRTRIFWPDGIGEWQTVKAANPEKDGESWPRKPLWGYVNEADPRVMEKQIENALAYGVNVFIYDWYWYDRRPFLENCLNDGFLGAKNNREMRFYLMWANHSATCLWDVRNSHDGETVIWDGAQDRAEFDRLTERIAEKYFTLPNYYKIDGKPVFMIYDLRNLARGLGGYAQIRDALAAFDRTVRERYRLPGVHFQYVIQEREAIAREIASEGLGDDPAHALAALGFESATHYQYVHFMDIASVKTYPRALEELGKEYARLEGGTVPYFPHVSLGWDNNLRFRRYDPAVLNENTPDNIEAALLLARDYLDKHPDQPRLVTINSWNEWTEGSYLEPDDRFGYGYLEAVKRVFG